MPNKKSDKEEILQAISGLSVAVFSLTEKVGDLSVKLDKLTERVDTLTERVDTLTERVDTLTERVDTLTARVDKLSFRVDALEQQNQDILLTMNHFADQMEQRLLVIEQRLARLEIGAVTKEYLDEKLYSFKGDMVVMFRQENTKLETLVEALQEQRSLSLDKGKRILALEPFPKI